MKVFISADIEGITGVSHWDETDANKGVYGVARDQMCAEVGAACEGALEAGATDIWVRDAHDSARNLIPNRLPKGVTLVRGWAADPLMMMQEIDSSFDAAALIGYHSRAASNTSPLAHTMTGDWARISINGIDVSECFINTYSAAMFNVPVVFVSGDKGLCEEVATINSAIKTVAVKEGHGNSTIDIHPQIAVERIKAGMAEALKGDISKCRIKLPDHYVIEIQYRSHIKAFTNSFYPGARLIKPNIVHFEHKEYYELLRFMQFVG